jgi:hypothetical protein
MICDPVSIRVDLFSVNDGVLKFKRSIDLPSLTQNRSDFSMLDAQNTITTKKMDPGITQFFIHWSFTAFT